MSGATPERPPSVDETTDQSADQAADQAAAEHRRRVDRVFGAVLADTTEDERGPGEERGGGSHDDWLRSNVPPHHG